MATVVDPQTAGFIHNHLSLPPYGAAYMLALLLAAHVVDESFQDVASKAASAAGAKHRAAKVKSLMRVLPKLQTDHADAPAPQSAENCDCNRCAWILPADRFEAGYAAAVKAFGEPIRVKNGYAPDFDVGATHGYRALLVNFCFDLGASPWARGVGDGTWGAFMGSIATAAKEGASELNRNLWTSNLEEEAIQRIMMISGLAPFVFQHSALQSTPAKLVVEIQMMTPEYAELRKKTHAWYRLARNTQGRTMVNDYQTSIGDLAWHDE